MNKDKGSTGYQITRFFGSPIFKMAYEPLILNKEYIPNDGPILLCGNHLHVWDQFPVICATKRTTHWMSKKEYFDSAMGPFFKATGAICVDRKGNAKLAENIALEYLEINSAVGLFPEGTRNGLKTEHINNLYNRNEVLKTIPYQKFHDLIKLENPKLSQVNLLEKLYTDKKISEIDFVESILDVDASLQKIMKMNIISEDEYNDSLLLPFKYGAVSMAAKTGAKIVPFAVTGDYQVGNDNLIVSFGEPILCSKDSLEEDNKKLRNKVMQLELKNLQKKSKSNK